MDGLVSVCGGGSDPGEAPLLAGVLGLLRRPFGGDEGAGFCMGPEGFGGDQVATTLIGAVRVLSDGCTSGAAASKASRGMTPAVDGFEEGLRRTLSRRRGNRAFKGRSGVMWC